MRKMIFALAIAVTGAFAFVAGGPANAAPAAPVSGLSDVVNSGGALETVHYRRHRHWHRRHWRHRSGRHCWWRHGHRHCRWGW